MSVITFDIAAFRAAFPQFTSDTTFPDETLQGYWDVAIVYISDSDYGYLAGAARTRALNLMTAHLAALGVLIAAGQVPGLVSGSTVDKISVTLTPPPVKDLFMWWLSLTPYGQQLAALLSTWSVGGMYIVGHYRPRVIN
ncbi:MAG: DUF4054 domain-containing protein [Methylocystis sp.]|uniref:DUF4054 domain-containing protein n=1 Tax=Methylocystis sp. TaxID=1911079 RepID=UPI003DA1CC39